MDKAEKMSEIRDNFSRSTWEYDAWIRKVIPRYEEMMDVLLSCLSIEREGGARVIDLGCGTGNLSQRLLDRHPNVDLTCLDMTESMLDQARERMKGHANVRYVLSDLYEFKFDGPYDAVISSLALHHLITDQDKRSLYKGIFEGLSPGGLFLNADLVLGADEDLQRKYMEKWTEFMYLGLPQEEVDGSLLSRHYSEDSPAKLTDHLRWLEEGGFRSVDVMWKYYNFAVFGGRR